MAASGQNNLTRIRLILDYFQHTNMRKCWFIIDHMQTPTIGSMIHVLKSRFSIPTSAKIDFFLDDFEVPLFENSNVLRDNDLVRLNVTPELDNHDVDTEKILCDSFTQSTSSSFDNVTSSTEINVKKKKKKRHQTDSEYSPSKSSINTRKDRKKSKNLTEDSESNPGEVSNNEQERNCNNNIIKIREYEDDTCSSGKDISTHNNAPGKTELDVELGQKMESNSFSLDEESVSEKRDNCQIDLEAEQKLQEFIDNLPEAKRQRRGGRGRNRKSKRRVVPANIESMNDISNMSKELDENYTNRENSNSHASTDEDFVIHQKKDSTQKINKKINKQQKRQCRRDSLVNAPELVDVIHKNNESELTEEKIETEKTPEKIRIDFSTFPLMKGLPRTGDRIAFKILEMSINYEPVISDFKLADVLNIEGETVQLQLLDGNNHVKKNGRFDLGEEYIEENSDTFWFGWNVLLDVRIMAKTMSMIAKVEVKNQTEDHNHETMDYCQETNDHCQETDAG